MAFGITRYELLKLLLQVATLIAIITTSTIVIVGLNNSSAKQAKLITAQAEETEARTRLNEQIVSFMQGKQHGLEERIDEVEADVKKPRPVQRVVVVLPTPVPTVTPTPAPKRKRTGLLPLLMGDDEPAPTRTPLKPK